MGTSNHFNMETLFDQLGLSSSPESIDHFLQSHYIKKKQRIEETTLWSSAQSSFLKEAIYEDSD
jgi:hypothetical protein